MNEEKLPVAVDDAWDAEMDADDIKKWREYNAIPRQIGKTEKYFTIRHSTNGTGAADK